MITDLDDLDAVTRFNNVKLIDGFLKQKPALKGLTDDYQDLSFAELAEEVEFAKADVENGATIPIKNRAHIELAFYAAKARDIKYGAASRRQLAAHTYNEAMIRNYFAGRTKTLYP